MRLILALLLVCFLAGPAFAVTTHSGCKAAADNDTAYLDSNEADECLDDATHDVASLALDTDGQTDVTDATLQATGFFEFTGALTADETIDLAAAKKRFTVQNSSTGGFALIVQYSGGGENVRVGPGATALLHGDGTDVVLAEGWRIVGEVQTTDATATAVVASDALAAGEAVSLLGQVLGLKSTGEAHAEVIHAVCRNAAGTTTCTSEAMGAGGAGVDDGTVTGSVDCDIAANDTDETGELQCTGATSETWDWRGELRPIVQ